MMSYRHYLEFGLIKLQSVQKIYAKIFDSVFISSLFISLLKIVSRIDVEVILKLKILGSKGCVNKAFKLRFFNQTLTFLKMLEIV